MHLLGSAGKYPFHTLSIVENKSIVPWYYAMIFLKLIYVTLYLCHPPEIQSKNHACLIKDDKMTVLCKKFIPYYAVQPFDKKRINLYLKNFANHLFRGKYISTSFGKNYLGWGNNHLTMNSGQQEQRYANALIRDELKRPYIKNILKTNCYVFLYP
jgi:hypothetical protein